MDPRSATEPIRDGTRVGSGAAHERRESKKTRKKKLSAREVLGPRALFPRLDGRLFRVPLCSPCDSDTKTYTNIDLLFKLRLVVPVAIRGAELSKNRRKGPAESRLYYLCLY